MERSVAALERGSLVRLCQTSDVHRGGRGGRQSERMERREAEGGALELFKNELYFRDLVFLQCREIYTVVHVSVSSNQIPVCSIPEKVLPFQLP